jgi:hypothetical protein
MTATNTCFVSAKTGSLITCEGRLSYAQFLFNPNPDAKTKKGAEKYTLSFLIPPGSDLAAAKKAAADAVAEEWPNEAKRPRGLKSPFLDAEEKMGDEWKGWTLLRLSTTRKPGVILPTGADAKPEDVYSGRWARLSLKAGTYDVDGNKGASFFLNNVQLLRNDDPIGGAAPKATSDFEPVAVGEGADAEDLFA